ncbi:hypothetical protein DUNSADRAFT_5626 [Dunaliella salina]|uniref:FAD dependent oxidoreductase domain-containing protein n=1 Tax=Dunaliella salina TaxID=3046 RepID=A0ABQ7FUL9_DUNSA|nr:hypothetical protein DUNSADRAFT_5626 [Dunaliella salina]|eukprot:KAF5825968.1 hypothetical protein DUNSADRAFT_5626 [Dunaliella salina]
MIPNRVALKGDITNSRRCILAQRKKMNTRNAQRNTPQAVAQSNGAPQTGQIVIVGGGIVGAATAHFLSELGVAANATIIERCKVACAASGKP